MITENSKVKVHYTGRFDDGQVFDSSMPVEGNPIFNDREPLEIELGKGMIIPGFEKALQGMAEGETKTFTIKSEDAYGPVKEDQIQEVDKTILPEGIQVGDMLRAVNPDGQTADVKVKEIKENTVILDTNHIFAGKDLTFDVKVVTVL